MSEAQSTALTKWMTDYRAAWESADPNEIKALFTEDALYYTDPFVEPMRGWDEIVELWAKRADAPGTTTFTWSPFVITDELAIITGETDYGSIKYSNLWVIRFAPDGRATEFTEWWMDQGKPSSA
jgi:ketosteroid isomerase-like protein